MSGGITGQNRWLIIDTLPEAVPGSVNAVPVKGYPYMGAGGWGLGEGPLFDPQTVEGNRTSQPAEGFAGFQPSGDIEIVPSPFSSQGNPTMDAVERSWMYFLLNWATKRTANVLDSHTLVCASPHASAVHGRRVTGCKPNNMRLGWDEGNRLANVTMGLTGMIPSKETAWSAVTPTFPVHLAWNFTLMAMQVGANAADVVTSEVSVRGFSMELNNGISHGPLTYYYDDAGVKIEGPASVDEGTHKVTGSFTIKKMDASWLDRFYGQTECAIRLLGFHPSSAVELSTTGTFITSSGDVNISVADTSDFEAGDVVYLEDSSAADRVDWVREVLYVNSVNESLSTISVETDGDDDLGESIGRGQSFTVGSRIYSKGIQLYIRDFVIKNREDEGGPTDQIYERIDFEAEAYSTFDPLGWLVR